MVPSDKIYVFGLLIDEEMSAGDHKVLSDEGSDLESSLACHVFNQKESDAAVRPAKRIGDDVAARGTTWLDSFNRQHGNGIPIEEGLGRSGWEARQDGCNLWSQYALILKTLSKWGRRVLKPPSDP